MDTPKHRDTRRCEEGKGFLEHRGSVAKGKGSRDRTEPWLRAEGQRQAPFLGGVHAKTLDGGTARERLTPRTSVT